MILTHLSKYKAIIEYDGELHFHPYKHVKGRYKKLKSTKYNDTLKTKWCNKNNIKLLRISYIKKKHYKELILEFLKLIDI